MNKFIIKNKNIVEKKRGRRKKKCKWFSIMYRFELKFIEYILLFVCW